MKIRLSKNERAGKLLVFEGTDGAGKSTQILLAQEYLNSLLGRERVICVKQPTDLSRKTKLFQKMMYCARHEDINYRAVQLLTLSDRIQHNSEVILPALFAGKWVICDRYLYTSVANMLARGYRKEKWFYQAAREIVRPDVVFFADVPAELAMQRIKARPEECHRYLDAGLLRRVHIEFCKMARDEGFIRLDTSQAAGKAFERVRAEIDTLYGRKA